MCGSKVWWSMLSMYDGVICSRDRPVSLEELFLKILFCCILLKKINFPPLLFLNHWTFLLIPCLSLQLKKAKAGSQAKFQYLNTKTLWKISSSCSNPGIASPLQKAQSEFAMKTTVIKNHYLHRYSSFLNILFPVHIEPTVYVMCTIHATIFEGIRELGLASLSIYVAALDRELFNGSLCEHLLVIWYLYDTFQLAKLLHIKHTGNCKLGTVTLIKNIKNQNL